MFIELLSMNGYGQFVWTAFVFSLSSCLYLYLKVRIEFKQHEKIYLLELREQQVEKIYIDKRKKAAEEALSIN